MPGNRHPGFLCHLATLAVERDLRVSKPVASVVLASSAVLGVIL